MSPCTTAVQRLFTSVLASAAAKIRSTACRSLTGVRHEEQAMSMNRDQVKGRIREAKGKIKEAAGKLVGNEKLEQKGKAQKILGEAQAKFGDVKKDVKETVKNA
jgi:uncharacterized protein YjbJ (UPF0337 family)